MPQPYIVDIRRCKLGRSCKNIYVLQVAEALIKYTGHNWIFFREIFNLVVPEFFLVQTRPKISIENVPKILGKPQSRDIVFYTKNTLMLLSI